MQILKINNYSERSKFCKASIIGAGEGGASCATCLANRDFVNEIIIVDVKPGLAEGKALDLRQSDALKRFDTIVKGYTAY